MCYWRINKLLYTENELQSQKVIIGGDDVPKFEPKKWLNFRTLDKSIQELRAMYKAHPEWFEVPKLKSDKGKNVVDYSILT